MTSEALLSDSIAVLLAGQVPDNDGLITRGSKEKIGGLEGSGNGGNPAYEANGNKRDEPKWLENRSKYNSNGQRKRKKCRMGILAKQQKFSDSARNDC